MRKLSLILIVVIGIMTLTPAPAVYPAGQRAVSIQTLDVCNGPATGLHANMPDFINERSGQPAPLLIVSVRNLLDPIFTPPLITNQDERPPRA